MIEVCQAKKIELLLIAGDLFHRQPLLRELKEVNYLFSKIKNTKIVLIAGNHDYLKPDSYYHTFPWSENVYPLFEKQMTHVEFQDIKTCVYGFSYFQKEITEPMLQGNKAKGYQPYEILLVHGGDEKHLPIKKNMLVGAGYHYVALGHIHKPQEAIEGLAVYAGALEPIEKNETGRHGYILGELTENGLKHQFIPSAVREYIHLELVVNENTTNRSLMEQLGEAIEKRGRHHIYKVILKGLRSAGFQFDRSYLGTRGEVIEIVDETTPAYDFQKLLALNTDNLLGKYIGSLLKSDATWVESQALLEGVQALLETKRG